MTGPLKLIRIQDHPANCDPQITFAQQVDHAALIFRLHAGYLPVLVPSLSPHGDPSHDGLTIDGHCLTLSEAIEIVPRMMVAAAPTGAEVR